MKMIREIILHRIELISNEEDNFKTKWWKDYYVDFQNSNGAVHVSVVVFKSLNDEDLVRLYGWLLLTRDVVSVNRVNEIYFKN